MNLSTSNLWGAVLLALTAAVAKYALDGWADRRRARLERLNLQLERLYGPLLALSHANDQAWTSFRAVYRSQGSYWDPKNPPTPAEAVAWRLWITEVFMPLNERLEALTINQSHLLEEDEVPPCLLALCAHVEAYRGILAEWRNGNFTQSTPPVLYPGDVLKYACERYLGLKSRQAALVRAGV
jgi:hypothetical protein